MKVVGEKYEFIAKTFTRSMNVCPFFMPDFLIKSSGLQRLPPTSQTSSLTGLQSMTQTNRTLIGLTEIQSNTEILCDRI